MIKKVGDKWCLYTKNGSKKLGCHATKEGAEAQERAIKAHATHHLTLRTLAGATYTVAQFEGRDHYVIPVVALVEGVVWPVTADAPELVLAEEFSITPGGWNGRPVFCGHPMVDGECVSGNDPDLLPNRIGTIFNTKVENDKLTMEAWVDPERCITEEAKDLLAKIQNLEPFEVSTGLIALTEDKTGVYKGKRYFGIWRRIAADHLALLPEGEIGACSLEMGCGGLRAASHHIHTINEEGIVMAFIANRKKGMLTAEAIAKIKALLPAPKSIEQQAEEDAELIAFQTIEFLLQQSQDTIKESLSTVAEMIAVETNAPTMTPAEEDAEHVVEHARMESLYGMAGAAIDSLYKVLSLCNMFMMAEAGEHAYYAKGARHSKIDQKMLQTVHDNSVALGAECSSMTAASAHECSKCSKQSGEDIMNKEQRIAALMANAHCPIKDKATLDALNDAALTALEASVTAAATAATELQTTKESLVAAQGEISTLKAAAANPKVVTEAEFLAAHPSINEIVVNHRNEQAARKTELVTKLKAAQTVYDEPALVAMGNDELEKLALLAKVDTTTVVDYSGRGGPRPPEQKHNMSAPPAPNLVERIKAQQTQQKKEGQQPTA